MHTLITKSFVNRYGTRLFVMCVCKSVLSAHPTSPNERCPRCQQAKNKPSAHPSCTPLGVRMAVIPMYSKTP